MISHLPVLVKIKKKNCKEKKSEAQVGKKDKKKTQKNFNKKA